MNSGHRIPLIKACRSLCLLLMMVVVLMGNTSFGQDSGSIAKALLALRTLNGPNSSSINGRLYAGAIDSTILHLGGSVNEVLDNDLLSLTVSDRNNSLPSVTCGTTDGPLRKAAFDACVRSNIDGIVKILFPSISSGVSGRNAAQNHSQLFLVTTALGLVAPRTESRRRTDIGGMVEHEWFSDENLSGHAWQGLYQFERLPLSIHGRYARQHDAVNTGSATVSADYHPSWIIHSSLLEWRVGADARTGLMYARSSSLNDASDVSSLHLGSLDFGGGIWTSARKDFSRVRVGGATFFQGTKSHTPTSLGGDDLAFLAEAMNRRPVEYDVAYGGLVGFLSSERSSINGRFMETRSVASETDWPRPPARLAMIGVSYLFGGITPIDVGYKISTAGGITAHSVYAQGNFRW